MKFCVCLFVCLFVSATRPNYCTELDAIFTNIIIGDVFKHNNLSASILMNVYMKERKLHKSGLLLLSLIAIYKKKVGVINNF